VNRLKAIIMDKTKPMEERFAASLKLAEIPRNCGRHRIATLRNDRTAAGVLPQHKLSRIALRELGSKGLIPGLGEVELVRGAHAASTIRSAI